MNKRNGFISLSLAALFLLASCEKRDTAGDANQTVADMKENTSQATPEPAGVKKYGVKSGIITYEQKISPDLPPIKSIVYFDDWGMKECKETYENGAVKEAFFSNGKNLYNLISSDKTAWNRGNAYSGTEMKFSVDDIKKSAEYYSKKNKNVKVEVLPNETIAGKDCEVILFDQGNGNPTKFAGWQGITMMMELMGQIKTVTKAVDIQTDVPVPAEKFTVPAGYTEKTM